MISDYIPISQACADSLFEKFKTSPAGLSGWEASRRLKSYGYNEPAKPDKRTFRREILPKFLNPLVVLLILIGALSLFFGQTIQAFLILLMIFMSVFL